MSNKYNDYYEYNRQYLALKIKEIKQKIANYIENEKNSKDQKIPSLNNGVTKGSTHHIDKNQVTQGTFDNASKLAEYEKNVVNDNFYDNFSNKPGEALPSNIDYIPAIEKLSQTFGLTNFEKSVLLLSAAVELDLEISGLCFSINNAVVGNTTTGIAHPTFALCFGIFTENSHWSALLPTSPLRRLGLVQFGRSMQQFSNPLVTLPIVINEQVLHYLLGLEYAETDMFGILQNPSKIINIEIEKISDLKSFQYYNKYISLIHNLCKSEASKAVINYGFNDDTNQNQSPLIILSGGDEIDALIIAQQVCNIMELNLKYLNSENIPVKSEDLREFSQSWTRDAGLLKQALFISHKNSYGENQNQILQSLKSLVENVHSPVFLHLSEPLDFTQPNKTVHLKKTSKTEQLLIWTIFLKSYFKTRKAGYANDRDQMIKKLINQFDFTTSEILQVCNNILDVKSTKKNTDMLFQRLWSISLEVSKPRVGSLGILLPTFSESSSNIESSDSPSFSKKTSLDDIVLPPREKEMLKTIIIHSKHRDKVYREWGFGEKSRSRGLGITVLFVGPSGTGKTMAAEILANALNLNLLKVDLSQVVSKFIGDTERNLEKIFESSKKGGCVLHCDEADALFGKRAEVTEGLDRYANIETSFLLQRMESYSGIVILSTNMYKALDNAFLRRINYKIKFEVPGQEERLEIWKRMFPRNTPVESIKFENLASLKLTGGSIRNICLHASFFAAEEELPVNNSHINRALQIEYTKLGQTLTDTQFIP